MLPPPAGIGAACAGATATASAGATATMRVPPTLPVPGSPPLLLLPHRWSYCPSQHLGELAQRPPCSQSWGGASVGAGSFGARLLMPQLVCRQMAGRLSDRTSGSTQNHLLPQIKLHSALSRDLLEGGVVPHANRFLKSPTHFPKTSKSHGEGGTVGAKQGPLPASSCPSSVDRASLLLLYAMKKVPLRIHRSLRRTLRFKLHGSGHTA